MTKFVLSRPEGPWDYPSFGFRAADGAVLDGTAFTPEITNPPDQFWTVYGGGSAQTGITLIGTGGGTATEPLLDGLIPVYRRSLGTYVPIQPAEFFAEDAVADELLEAVAGLDLVTPAAVAATLDDPAVSGPLATSFGRRQASVVVAASDSPEGEAADFICDGTDDQVTINAAIESVAGQGGRVVLRVGTYLLTAPVIVNRSYVHLEGEVAPHWGRYWQAWPASGPHPVGEEGEGCAKLKMLTTGTDLVVFNVDPDTGARISGSSLRKMYLYGYNHTGRGILATDAIHDMLSFEDLFIHNTLDGAVVSLDSPSFRRVSVQDCAGTGIKTEGGNIYGTAVDCVIADCGGYGLNLTGRGFKALYNTLVDLDVCIGIGGPLTVAIGNVCRSWFGVGILTASTGSSASIQGNTLDATANEARTYPSGNPAILLAADGAGNYASVTGNTIYCPTDINAVAISALPAGNAGHTIVGNSIRGPWAMGGATKIGWKTGNGHQVGLNSGDNATATA